MPLWLREKLFQKNAAARRAEQVLAPTTTGRSRLLFTEHHQSHAASAFFPSPFEEAAVLTMDGVGEWATTSVGVRPRQRPRRSCKEIHFPHSLGLLYSAFTYYTGFKVNSGEYKVMGLAPYGEPKYRQADSRQSDRSQARRHRSGSISRYFDYCTGLTHDQSRKFDRAVRRRRRASRRSC